MSFKLTKEDLKKSQKCPPGMHLATLSEVEDEYLSEKGVNVQKCFFETDSGYSIPTWFNDSVTANLFEFLGAADKVTFSMDTFQETDIRLKDYLGKRVAISVSHSKSPKDGKIYAQIDNFYNADKVPF